MPAFWSLISVVSLSCAVFFHGAAVRAQQTWLPVDELPDGEVFALLVDADTLYALIDSSVHYRSHDNPNWQQSSPIPSDTPPSSLIKKGDRLFVGTYGSGVFETSNLGLDWTPRTTGLSGVGAMTVTALAVRHDSLYAGTSGAGVFVMNLNGPFQWATYRTGMPSLAGWDVQTLHEWSGWLFCGSGQNANVYINAPGESTWQEVPFGDFIPTGLAMHAIEGTGFDLIGAASNGIYTSVDTGASWEHYATPFSAAGDGAVVSAAGRTFVLLMHASRGAYIFERTDDSWSLFDHQLVYCYDLAAFGDRLYAARLEGLWCLPLSPTDVGGSPGGELPTGVRLEQNYPNPFNPATTISFSLREASPVRLAVYNVLGQSVRVVLDGIYPAGNYRTVWDGTDDQGRPVAGGVYFYRLVTAHETQSRKMLLVK
ncbi:MAG: T9SS type A sorting domain-containing protein [candidate division Zixibacteria bacterium]|jgi:hypothetical protein|nr:T9SS type A sorting domain-containing protein [candidate division Zixibacteria bacterium]